METMPDKTIAKCCECEAEFAERRKALGYDTCLNCGEKAARVETENKRQRVAPRIIRGL